MIVDLYLVYKFIRKLVKPFDKWEAYKLGIIDADGNILKSRKSLRGATEKEAFTLHDLLILNIKKLLKRVPLGRAKLSSYATALYLIREFRYFTPSSMLTEESSEEDILYITEKLEVGLPEYIKLLEAAQDEV